MALQTSGAISMADIYREKYGSLPAAGSNINLANLTSLFPNMNQSAPYSMNEFYGQSALTPIQLSLAGYVTYGYLDSQSACNADLNTADVNGVYTESGYLDLGSVVYWNQSGTSTLGNGYYKEESGYVIQISNGVISNTNIFCSGGGGMGFETAV